MDEKKDRTHIDAGQRPLGLSGGDPILLKEKPKKNPMKAKVSVKHLSFIVYWSLTCVCKNRVKK